MRYSTVQYRAIQQLASETGIDAEGIYCQVTGRMIGYLDLEVMQDIFASMPDMDAESISDDLRIRTLTSMRPSPAWNYLRPNTLALKVKSDPIGLLSYLLIRCEEPVDLKSYVPDLQTQMGRLQNRITMWQVVNRMTIDSETLEALLLVLLELDAKFSLKNLAVPHNIRALLLGNPKDTLTILSRWRDKLVDAEIKRQNEQSYSDRSFTRGNAAAKQAFVQELIRQTPVSERKTLDLKKVAVRQEIGDIFDELEVALRKPGTSGPTVSTKSQAAYKAEAEAKKPAPINIGKKFSFKALAK